MTYNTQDHERIVARILADWPKARRRGMHKAIRAILRKEWPEDDDDIGTFDEYWADLRQNYLCFVPDAWVILGGGRAEKYTLLCFEADNTNRTGRDKLTTYCYAYEEFYRGEFDVRLICYDADGHTREMDLHWLSTHLLMLDASQTYRDKLGDSNAAVWAAHDEAIAKGLGSNLTPLACT